MNNTSTSNSSIDLIQFIWNHKTRLIVIGLFAAVIGAVVSLLIEEKFKSTVTLYPTLSSTVSFTDDVHAEQSASSIGEEEQAEQMLQLLESGEVRNRIIQKYNLAKHYEIDSSSATRMTDLTETYYENVSFRRTRLGSVLIEVLDKNPQMAADMANDIARYVDSTKNRMIRERSFSALEVAKRERNRLLDEVQSIVDTMQKLSRIGVVDKETRPSLISALATVKDAATRNLIRRKIDATDKYGGVYANLEHKLEWMNIRLSTKEAVYEQINSDAHATLSHKQTVEHAYAAEKKSYPIRWLIVVVSAMAATFFALLALLVFDRIKSFK